MCVYFCHFSNRVRGLNVLAMIYRFVASWLFMKIVWSALAHMHLLSLTGVDKHFLIILCPTKKKKEVTCAKKLGKGPLKSLDFQCDLFASSSVARGGAGGARADWLVKYAKTHVFCAFEADFL